MRPKLTMLGNAFSIAANAFRTDVDAHGAPYFEHCLKVMYGLPEGADEDLKCIAILHDIIEDTDMTELKLEVLGFNKRIVQGVIFMTKELGQPEDHYYETLLCNDDAIIVKLADLKHNGDVSRQKGGRAKDEARVLKYFRRYRELEAVALERGLLNV
jgi:(p)ppGpp synthase/HD superfamily hydrolase